MILAYKGKSLLSWWIRIGTWSDYSHISHVMADGSEVEAWSGGVQHNKDWGILHTKGTEVDVFDYVTPITAEQGQKIEAFLLLQVGKGYDYIGLFLFLPIVRWFTRQSWETDRWFCAKLEMEAQSAGGQLLVHKEAYRVTPEDVAASPILKKVGTWVVGKLEPPKKLDIGSLPFALA